MIIGPYTLSNADAGCFRLDGGGVFGMVPKALWSKSYPMVDDDNCIPLACRVLVIRGHGRVFLVDAGCGTKMSEKMRTIYAMRGSESFVENLAAVGVAPADVTDVIFTHLHFDHSGGATVRKGSSVVPLFPTATHWVQKEHLDWARSPSERDAPSFMPDDWEPLAATGQLKVLDGACKLAPGLEIRVAGGHTPGMQMVVIRNDPGANGPAAVLHGADLLPAAAMVSPRHIGAFDNFPITTVREKRDLLEEVIAKRWAVYFGHDVGAPLAYLEREGRGFVAGESLTLDETPAQLRRFS